MTVMNSNKSSQKQKIALIVTIATSTIILLFGRDFLYLTGEEVYFSSITPLMLFGAFNAIVAALITSSILHQLTETKTGPTRTVYRVGIVIYSIIAILVLAIYVLSAIFASGCSPSATSR